MPPIDLKNLTKEYSLYHPQESLLKIKEENKRLTIGIPKERHEFENRVSLRPEAVEILVANGHEVIIETDAGIGAKYTDNEYSNAGAQIVYTKKEVYQTELVLKVNPPEPKEYEFLSQNQTIVSALQLSTLSEELIKTYASKKITAIAYEFFEDAGGEKTLVRAMSEIAGSTVMLIAAEYLNTVNNGQGIILGGITGVLPSKVVILGSGTVAEMAAKTALGLGASVKVFDNQIYKLRRLLNNIGQQQLFTCTFDTAQFRDALSRADVVIGCMRPEDGRSPSIVTQEMVAEMKPNSIIIDVNIDSGGCFETSRPTTHADPIYKVFDVVHYCVPNIPSRVARTASTAISNILLPVILKAAKLGGIEEMTFKDKGFARGIYSYKGHLTNEAIAKKFNMKCKDLNLIIAASL